MGAMYRFNGSWFLNTVLNSNFIQKAEPDAWNLKPKTVGSKPVWAGQESP